MQRGDIVVERLTGRPAMVINVVASSEEVTCRFGDGRLEDRFTFELEPTRSFFRLLLSLLIVPFVRRPPEKSTPSPLAGRVRPLILRQSSPP